MKVDSASSTALGSAPLSSSSTLLDEWSSDDHLFQVVSPMQVRGPPSGRSRIILDQALVEARGRALGSLVVLHLYNFHPIGVSTAVCSLYDSALGLYETNGLRPSATVFWRTTLVTFR